VTAEKWTQTAPPERARNPGQSGFAAARWPPQNERSKLACLGQFAEQLTGAEQMLLPDKFIQGFRPHAFG
jgi:hypothetical protein